MKKLVYALEMQYFKLAILLRRDSNLDFSGSRKYHWSILSNSSIGEIELESDPVSKIEHFIQLLQNYEQFSRLMSEIDLLEWHHLATYNAICLHYRHQSCLKKPRKVGTYSHWRRWYDGHSITYSDISSLVEELKVIRYWADNWYIVLT